MKKHLIFVINPHAGTDRKKSIEKSIFNKLNLEEFSFEIIYTQYAKQGIEIARKASIEKAYAVIAVGGDGSVNDVATGLISTDTILGIVPKGSGNGLARSLKIPLKIEQAIAIICKNKVQKIDVGKVNENYFLSNAGVGFDALVCQEFAMSTQRGFASYAKIILNKLFNYQSKEYQISTDGQFFNEKAFFINIANGAQMGYQFKIAPGASLNDGLFDVITVQKFPLWNSIGLAVQSLNGTILKNRYVLHKRASNIKIAASEPLFFHTDGDIHKAVNKELEFTILPQAIHVFVP